MYKVVLMQRRSMNFDFIYRTFIISNKIDSGKITIFIIRNMMLFNILLHRYGYNLGIIDAYSGKGLAIVITNLTN